MSTAKERKRMREAVAYLQNYMNAYSGQAEYENYTDETLINDVLYGLGVALNATGYQFASGFEKFKDRLFSRLASDGKRAASAVLPEPATAAAVHPHEALGTNEREMA